MNITKQQFKEIIEQAHKFGQQNHGHCYQTYNIQNGKIFK